MQTYQDIMKNESVLPEDFSGVFYFNNWSEEDFVGKWGGKEYHYPAQTSSPMLLPEHSPIEIQSIRKKFAKDLAEREFFKGNTYEMLRSREGKRDPDTKMIQPTGSGMSHAGTYSLDNLAPLIQKALQPLPVSRAVVRKQNTVTLVEKLTTNEDGEITTGAIKEDKDLRILAQGEKKDTLAQKAFGQ